MAKEIYDLRETINNWNPLIRMFFRWKFRKAIEFADLIEGETILDFGCNGKYLKRLLKTKYYYGYDINEKFTELKSYKDINPDVIFALDVLEHINKKELKKIINYFKNNEDVRLITIIPNETWLWLLLRKILIKQVHF